MAKTRICFLIPFVVSILEIPRAFAEPDFTCDFANDNCPSQFNGVCDSIVGTNALPGCGNTDCFDCDQCTQFNYDCYACLAATGCYYCAGDGTCSNSHSYIYTGMTQSCTEPVDYLVDGETCSLTQEANTFSDPLYDGQKWVYDMIKVVPVWEKGYFGNGVRVRINDDGIESSHLEFDGRYDANASCAIALPLDDDSDGHGTAVASILGGASDNDKCASGIAPEVKISSCNVFADIPLTILSEKVQTFDISQNSWGIPACGTGLSEGKRRLQQNIGSCPFKSRPEGLLYEHPCDVCDFTAEVTSPQCEVAVLTHCNTNKQFENDEISCLDFLDLIIGDDCNFNKLPQSALDSISEGVQKGRDGKGIVYVFASGNEYATGDDVNFGGLTNSRLTITVGGVGKDGLHASYSTPGAALFVSAPGGDMEAISNHMAASPNDGCTSTLPGTSFSSPVVSGVIALMLEANPLLTWRDVQGILASTSQFVADPKDITATLNGAGVWHSNLYGFGIIDANAAVSAAENWTLYDPETFMVGESGSINVTISDDPLVPAQSSINITGDTEDDDLIAESVAVFLQLEHFSRGDLEILLTSPSGTVSVLTPGRRIENTQLEVDTRWKLLTVRNWGESAIGQWSLSIRDLNKGDVAECANAPFSTVFKGQSITCLTVESQEWCVGGERNSQSETNVNDLFTRQQNGITISEACCVCGGGLSSSDVKDRLMQWKLIVYGQYRGDNPPQQNVNSTAAPSATTALTFTPSAANASLAPVPAPVPSMTSNSTNSISTTSSKPSTTEMAIIITGTIFVFLAVVIAVRWACKPPVSASKFKSLNKTAEIT